MALPFRKYIPGSIPGIAITSRSPALLSEDNRLVFQQAALGCRAGAVVTVVSPFPPMWPGFNSQTQRHMRVEFVGSLLCSENQHLT